MTWNFWAWPGQIRRLQAAKIDSERLLTREQTGLQILRGTLARRDREIILLEQALQFKRRAPKEKPAEAQVLSALALVDESTPLWRAVHQMLDWLEQDQRTAVCLAQSTDAERHYNAGRLAMCEDLRDALLQKWAEALRENEEAQRP